MNLDRGPISSHQGHIENTTEDSSVSSNSPHQGYIANTTDYSSVSLDRGPISPYQGHNEIQTKHSSVMNVITTPFADDFNLITRNTTFHQSLVSDVQQKIQSMGLILKPSKCRALTIQEGKVTKVHFKLDDKETGACVSIATVEEKPMKFLGSEVTAQNTPHAMFAAIHSKLEKKLKNIDASTLRGEYKVNIYSRYALPSMRFYLAVHQMHMTHMEQLDALTRKFLKSWLGIQTRGVTDASIFHPYMLGIKAPSQLYIEAHAGNYAMFRSKGDSVVNHAVNSRLQRESQWTRKHSTLSKVHQMWSENCENPPNTDPRGERPLGTLSVVSAKKIMKDAVQAETLMNWNAKVKKLTFQGDFLNLLIEEETNVSWKSICNNMPKGLLSFALKASTNGLNTPDNLKRWGIRKFNKCDLCGNWSNLEHILNWCPVALNQGRFTWRHDSVLSHLTLQIKSVKPDNITVYADIEDHKMNGGSIPPDILVTKSRPDLVIINRVEKSIELLELTVSYEKNIEKAHIIKNKKYLDLRLDLEKAGWKTFLVPFEVGSRGQVTRRNKSAIYNTSVRNHIKLNHNKITKELSKIALLCSFSIFQANSEPSWQDPPLLHP